jgi:DnaK suppressor protein
VAVDRNAELRAALDARRRELLRDIQGRIREGRADRTHGVGDISDVSDADMHEDMDRALLQMRAETLNRIDDAISRLDEGRYGRCFECEGEIAAPRLRALPFAVRCRACEEEREPGAGRARRLGERRISL